MFHRQIHATRGVRPIKEVGKPKAGGRGDVSPTPVEAPVNFKRSHERQTERIDFARDQRRQANEFAQDVWQMVRAGSNAR